MSTGPRRWLGRVAVAGWLALGLGAALLAPAPAIPDPATAEQLFGEARSMQSSAPEGLHAFARLIEKLGFAVSAHRSAAAPKSDALVLLGPAVALEDEEVEALVRWLRDGGRLIYAPSSLIFQIIGDDDEAPEMEELPLDDGLVDGIARAGEGVTARGGAASLWRVGLGRVAIVDDAGIVLSNGKLKKVGLRGQLGWLRWVLEGAHTVAFDEARIGAAVELSPVEMLRASRFWPAVVMALCALAVWLLSRSVRRSPPQPLARAGGRDFGEHLAGVASLLERGNRVDLALRAMIEGTRRRLGPRATTVAAKRGLRAADVARRGRSAPERLAEQAEALRRLEAKEQL
jgi:hypothetical protein